MDYIRQNQIMHESKESTFAGMTLGKTLIYRKEVKRLIYKHSAFKLLDYGCGKGHQYTKCQIHKDWKPFDNIPFLYDPCYKPFKVKPISTFDGVICTDVLEHIPIYGKNSVIDVLDDLFNFTKNFLFITISSRLAKKKLPNGENAHITIKPAEWWSHKIKTYQIQNPKLDLVVYIEGQETTGHRKRIY